MPGKTQPVIGLTLNEPARVVVIQIDRSRLRVLRHLLDVSDVAEVVTLQSVAERRPRSAYVKGPRIGCATADVVHRVVRKHEIVA